MSDYILPELIPNILARLPMDDVLRCTSVCKSWYELITSPSFISLHLNLSSPNQEPRFFVEHHNDNDDDDNISVRYSLHRDNQTFDEIAEMDPPFPYNRKWDIIDCINGLFCLNCEGDVMVWNPSLRKGYTLLKPRVLPDIYHHTVGFGFVGPNDYKIIRVSSPNNANPVSEAQVYERFTGWRDLELGDYSQTYLFHKQVHLDGIVHWAAANSVTRHFICSFDLKTERFGTLMVPSSLSRDNDGRAYFIPSTFRESLCLTAFRKVDAFDLWVMKEYGVAKSWQKLFTIADDISSLTTYPKFRHNGDLLFGKFCYETSRSKLVCYDRNNNQFKNLGYLSNAPEVAANFPNSYVYTYSESLVLTETLLFNVSGSLLNQSNEEEELDDQYDQLQV